MGEFDSDMSYLKDGKEAVKKECDGKYCGDDNCPECCPHDDLDHGICLWCEKDLTEELAAKAYDRAKDLRKYGDC